jgi:hypothetical protein
VRGGEGGDNCGGNDGSIDDIGGDRGREERKGLEAEMQRVIERTDYSLVAGWVVARKLCYSVFFSIWKVFFISFLFFGGRQRDREERNKEKANVCGGSDNDGGGGDGEAIPVGNDAITAIVATIHHHYPLHNRRTLYHH